MIGIEDFDKVDVRVGTVTAVTDNKKSRNPAYVLTIDFGPELGIKNPPRRLQPCTDRKISSAGRWCAAST